MTSVLQPWLEEIPIRMQSTLLLGLRGADTHSCPNVKVIGRWLRNLSFKPGNPENMMGFMAKLEEVPEMIEEKSALAKELEFCSQHFYSHLMHALEVVAYRHPRADINHRAFSLYFSMCNLMHLPIEKREDFEYRLKTIEWPTGQPNTLEEAIENWRD